MKNFHPLERFRVPVAGILLNGRILSLTGTNGISLDSLVDLAFPADFPCRWIESRSDG